MTTNYDIGIIGGGLAGCCMAAALKKRNYSVFLIDNHKLSASSRIAAGIINPIVFKRTTLGWKALETIKFAYEFYTTIQELNKSKIIHQTPIVRIFSGFEEQNEWIRKSSEERFKPFIDDVLLDNSTLPELNAPFGMAKIKMTGWLDTIGFIENIKQLVGSENIQEGNFNYDQLIINEIGFTYNQYHFEKLLFCEGFLLHQNPFFDKVKLYPVKGEVLTIKKNSEFNQVVSSGVYCVPQSSNQLKIGATYNWQQLDHVPTPEGKNELVKKLSLFYNGAIEILAHEAGIRPAAKDRKPILGNHPLHPNMFILNGLGTKGVSLAPWCAELLADNMDNGTSIDKTIDVKRFFV